MAGFEDTPEDLNGKINRFFGVVEDVPCIECGKLFAVRKLNLVDHSRRESGSTAATKRDYTFVCDDCLEEIIRPLLRRYIQDPELIEAVDDALGKRAMWADDPEAQREAYETLKRLTERRQQRDE